MSHAHDAAIAFLVAQNVQERATALREEMTVTVKVTMNPEPRKSNGRAKNEAAPIHHKAQPMVGMMLPDRGSLDAKGFLLAMRDAGKRTVEGRTFVDPREKRNDEIRAIHAFYYEVRQGVHVCIGYDPKRDFGSQEQASRMLAQRDLRGAPKLSAHTAPSRTLGGYVAGMPDMKARKLADLQGREVAAVDAMLAHQRDADDTNRSPAERELSAGLAEVERERCSAIRADIAALL